jgi:3D-(3,5/4)-trihydroxycyclohexane-1,2-dione acylhydrolase (decyclizing)
MSDTLRVSAKTDPRRGAAVGKVKAEPSAYSKTESSPMRARARAIAEAGGSVDEALRRKTLSRMVDVTLSEALVLGLLKQDVRKYLAIFGHGCTDLGEVLRIYDDEGVTRTYNFRNEVAMAHAATTLRWQYGETPALVTSIGPGALQAMAGSLAAASNGIGVYHIYGDETTHGEGYNMQQIPKPEQELFGRITALMGESYVLHTGNAVRDALRRGTGRVHHPFKPGPFYILAPINVQPEVIKGLNLAALPQRLHAPRTAVADPSVLDKAVGLVRQHPRIVIKAGGGTRDFAGRVRALAEAIGAAVALSPGALGVLPDKHPQNLHVGGSKGSISGNFAMANATLAIIVGSRAVCQADCSGIGYERAEAVININGDLSDATHYNHTLALTGDIGATIELLLEAIKKTGGLDSAARKTWLEECARQKAAWRRFKDERFEAAPIDDAVWGKPVLGQPAAIKTVADFANSIGAVKYFDAGDIQANGFQIVEDDEPYQTLTETGASYMGFASSALAANGLAAKPQYGISFCGDGSFMMNPQALIDCVEHGVNGMIVIFDNRRMAAISSLQVAQYGVDFRTNDAVAVDYVKLASAVTGVKAVWGGDTRESLRKALADAHRHNGLSVVHVPVYAGENPLGGMGAYGSWNVGNWVDDVQGRYHKQDL